jgi:hypothetical protein
MRLELATFKAMKYACLNFHYAKSIPVNVVGFSVFNDKKEWCGCVVYGTGANNNIAKTYQLLQGEVIELVRMALNGKQESTSKALAISLKLISKYVPLAKLIVSYADMDQGHKGTIYKATNWFYTGISCENQHTGAFIIKGKEVHGRMISQSVKNHGGLKGLSRYEFVKKYLDVNATPIIDKGKIKYLYPLDKNTVSLCKSLSKPYIQAQ